VQREKALCVNSEDDRGPVIVACGGTMMLLAGSTLRFLALASDAPASYAGIAQNPCNLLRYLRFLWYRRLVLRGHQRAARAGGVYLAPAALSRSLARYRRVSAPLFRTNSTGTSGFVPGAINSSARLPLAHCSTSTCRAAKRRGDRRLEPWVGYAWPRDSSWVATALADTGHPAEAFKIMTFLERVQPGSGIWAARYSPDSGEPVRDGRPVEIGRRWLGTLGSLVLAGSWRQAGDRLVRQELTQLWLWW